MYKIGIYKITNKLNNKFYIGSSERIEGRWDDHIYLLDTQTHCNRHLKRAWKKYGEQNFIFEILEECPIEILILREQYYLDTLLFAQEYIRREDVRFLKLGYNINPIAGKNRKGTKQSIKSIKKSLNSSGKNRDIIVVNNRNEKIDEFKYVFEAIEKYNVGSCSFYQSINEKKLTRKGIGFIDKKDFEAGIKLIEPKIGNKGVSIPYKGKKRALDIYTIYGNFVLSVEDIYQAAKFLESEASNTHRKINFINPKSMPIRAKSFMYFIVDRGTMVKELEAIKKNWDSIFQFMKDEKGDIKVFNCFGEQICKSNSQQFVKSLNISNGGFYSAINDKTYIKSLKLERI